MLNKIDYIKENQLSDIITFTKTVVKDITKKEDIHMHPVSARLAREDRISNNDKLIDMSGISAPVSAIGEFLMKEKGAILINGFMKEIKQILDMFETYFKSSIELRQISLEDIRKKVNMFRDFMRNIDTSKKEVTLLLNGELKLLFESLDEDMMAEIRR
ncbi:MAG: hypothetical protein QME45_14220 [Clostridiales bacterium]|nr:hypothetical protein [Clostridiales bacterium]